MRLLYCLFFCGAIFLSGCGTPSDSEVLRVGTSGDYAPFSVAEAGGVYEGFDIELAKHFAADHEMKVRFVRFAWPDLLKDLNADAFDVAMGGVTVRPDRSIAARFSLPVANSGAVAIVHLGSDAVTVGDLDREGVKVGVNAGGHLERVARANFQVATLITTTDNQSLPEKLLSGAIDALVTDTLEAPIWLMRLPGAKALPPFTKDRKAWLVHGGKVELARRLDAWLLAREADGMLRRMRQKYLGATNPEPTATPMAALLATMDERLSLMPAVAESKRSLNKPIEDPAQEARVLQAAVEGVTQAALSLELPIPEKKKIELFFLAQMSAAKAIQRKVMKGESDPLNPRDLVTEIRPALARISNKMNYLLVRVMSQEEPCELAGLRAQVSEALADHDLLLEDREGIAKSVFLLCHSNNE